MSDSTALVDTPRNDPFARVAARTKSGNGLYMSFNRVGNFVAGQDKTKIPHGTRMIANMLGLRDGWRCWQDGRCVDDRTMPVIENETMEKREALGDNDPADWGHGPDGKPKDPWQKSYILELANNDGEIYIFSTSSAGGRGAIEKLCGEYGAEYRMRPNMAPIVELGRDSYQHKKYGEMLFPVFNIVGWTDADNPSVDDAEAYGRATGQRAANPTLVAVPTTATKPSSTTTKSPSSATDVGRTRF